jgi:hypothetical protein
MRTAQLAIDSLTGLAVGGIVASRVSSAGIPQEWRDAVEPLPNIGS